jgi:hypothetical protein
MFPLLEGRLAGATVWVDRAVGRERWLTRRSPCPMLLLDHGTGAGSPPWQSVCCAVEARDDSWGGWDCRGCVAVWVSQTPARALVCELG